MNGKPRDSRTTPEIPSAGDIRQSNIKTQALELVRSLPAEATWDDLMQLICVRQKIEAGMADITEGRTHSPAAIRKAFLKS